MESKTNPTTNIINLLVKSIERDKIGNQNRPRGLYDKVWSNVWHNTNPK